ncbi:LuxR C-terminal-related transcriptional regulator [Streptomyces cupreus]|uniref:Response regulator transcription factor n=1 Tax=Streptomyces cupreus TaxID=2759956 RepID=A0A7X1J8M6_9ACTN|nr:response regulator transcription factor [Streptomyces cupreus]MBC2903702.1 response regulator transcription factor [Streptomyces cupreus]
MDIRVVLCDEQRLVRAGLRSILDSETGITVVGEVDRIADAMGMVRRLNPAVVVMDVNSLRYEGGTAVREFAEMRSDQPGGVVVLAAAGDTDLVTQALLAGARGFLLKEDPAEQLVCAVRMVAVGAVVLTGSVTRPLLRRLAAERDPVTDRETCSLDRLTSRELEILRHIAQGYSTHQVAGLLFISETTVRSHIHHLLQKLELRSRSQAIALAYRSGLVASPPCAPEADSAREP